MRTDNLLMFENTLRIFNENKYIFLGETKTLKLSADEREEVQVFLPDEIQELRKADGNTESLPYLNSKTIFRCMNEDSFTQARKLAAETTSAKSAEPVENPAQENQTAEDRISPCSKPVLVLNLANPVNPGGGVRKGAQAQEEDLCRKSSLLFSLESEAAKKYYRYNKSLNTYMGSNAVMISPQVEILRDETGDLLEETVVVSVMTCAAPFLIFGLEGMSEKQYQKMVYDRITDMLTVAAHLGYENLVLGAFGCGAFENDAHTIAWLFQLALQSFNYQGRKTNDCFRHIDFAVLDHSRSKYNYREFAAIFGSGN